MPVVWTLAAGVEVGAADPGATEPPVAARASAAGSQTQTALTIRASRAVVVLRFKRILFDAYGVS
jgi:hypothetical protein